jgi:hypothetical protein
MNESAADSPKIPVYVPVFTPGVDSREAAAGEWSVWRSAKHVPQPKFFAGSHVCRIATALYRQKLGDSQAEYITNGGQAITILDDGTVVCFTHSEFVFVRTSAETPSCFDAQLENQVVHPLMGWPDGILVQPYLLNQNAPVYFVPILERRLRFEALVQVTDSKGLSVNSKWEFIRTRKLIAWLLNGVLNIFDIETGKRRTVPLLTKEKIFDNHLVCFDGDFVCIFARGTYCAKSGREISQCSGHFFAFRKGIAYALDQNRGHFIVSAVDLKAAILNGSGFAHSLPLNWEEVLLHLYTS